MSGLRRSLGSARLKAKQALYAQVVARVLPRVPTDTLSTELFRRHPSPTEAYGAFDTALHRDLDVTGLKKESQMIRGEIVACLRAVRWEPPVLLPGEYNQDRGVYTELLQTDRIVTAGLGPDRDYTWNFEDDPPAGLGWFGLIISQAMLEHLVDPYKHVSDCASLLDRGGVLILHTPSPGFAYHRHPIDCQRLYPDWFEEIAQRLGLTVEYRYLADLRVMYALRHQ